MYHAVDARSDGRPFRAQSNTSDGPQGAGQAYEAAGGDNATTFLDEAKEKLDVRAG